MQENNEKQRQQLATLRRVDFLLQKHRTGSSWFYWIAALSLIHSITILFASADWSFLAGLGFTQMVDGIALTFATESGVAKGLSSITVGAFGIDMLIAGTFALWGLLARNNIRWAYIVGMTIYFFDGLIFIHIWDFPSIAFHLFALFSLFGGLRACNEVNKLVDPNSFAEFDGETEILPTQHF